MSITQGPSATPETRPCVGALLPQHCRVGGRHICIASHSGLQGESSYRVFRHSRSRKASAAAPRNPPTPLRHWRPRTAAPRG
eukprot:3636858-Alexandrium_andersonii.AAC.1